MDIGSFLDDFIGRQVQPRQAARAPIWEALWQRRSPGRIAVSVPPTEERFQASLRHVSGLHFPEPLAAPSEDRQRWRTHLREDLARWCARWLMPGDGFPTLNVPRFAHGQSQGICDLFGARVEPQPDGNIYVHPLPSDPGLIARRTPSPLRSSMYWGAVEYIRWARSATGGRIAFRGPIMTGPFDTANYLLGTTVLMEWVYAEPEALQSLLERLTQAIGDMVEALRDAAGGVLHPHHLTCTGGGPDFASECRSLVSQEVYERFESPCLLRLGRRLGPYAIHSCGGWERTVPSARRDPNLRAMNGQVRENDLVELCRLAQGGMTYSLQPSVNLHERFTFGSREGFFAYVLERAPESQPLELAVAEEEIPLWRQLCARYHRPCSL